MKLFPERKSGQWIAAVGLLMLITSLGCATVQPTKIPMEKILMEKTSEPEPKLTLSPGDVLDIKFFYAPELNESHMVRPDGKITLQLLGELKVQGKTADELKDELVKLYASELKRPEIVVIVRSLYNRRVYVGGEVKTPGLIPLTGSMTALEAIIQAGGFNLQTAEVKNVVVIREREGRHFGTTLDFKEALKGREVQAFYLEPRDIVYVPRTVIVNVNQWIDQYINKIIPNIGLGYSRPLGDGTVGIDTSGR